ncbi:DUF4832 domain-containing protein [Lederbergia panacisoli]|uniref:DUF4832 domain-containing protein n=1 Tax=Lederbergia panacisoli TaxID=1255251 RepID=UPI00214AF7B5|nr:DUF4832 domain-containing protein [Lederbergia panacisoli]MCR2823569.1 DUF4832 domain-containing protein [Lederbergia panacisoli]
MKKGYGMLAILLIVCLVLSSSLDVAGSEFRSVKASGNDIVWNGADDREVAAVTNAVQNDTRKNASGPKITSNAQSAEFPGIYFIWDSKQSDNGYLKVHSSVFDKFDSFILTAKTANSYWDFEIAIKPGQEMTEDDCFVFFIPKVKEGKNINMVFMSEFKQKSLVSQELNYTENPVDIPNPDRGFYRPQSYVIPVNGGTPSFPNLKATITGTTVEVDARIVYMEFDLRNFSSNAPLNGRPIGPWSAPNATPPQYGTTQPITPAALDYVRQALQRVRDSDAVAIVKFSYDGQGYTYIDSGIYDQVIHDSEPGAPHGRVWYETGIPEESDLSGIPGHEDKNWVQYHLWQLGNVFSEFEDSIMTVKGGIFGPWGEMHSSSYARTREGYHWLLNALLNYVPDSRSILVHAGGVMAWHNAEYGTDYSFTNLMPAPASGTPAQRFGMFNDSYAHGGEDGAYDDWGSLSEGYALIGTGDYDDYDRNSVLTWIRNQNNFYGGETNTLSEDDEGYEDNIYPRLPSALYEAAYTQTTHLNTSWSRNTYKLWGNFVYNEENVTAPFTPPHDGVTRTAIFDPVYDGRSGMEYMRDRLGYRLVLREANASKWVVRNGTLRFEGKIQNVGFGNIVNKKNVSVILKAKDGSSTYTALTNLDARDWRPDLDSRASNTAAYRDLNFSIKMSDFGSVPAGDYDIYLRINDPKETSSNRRSIQFANHDIWNTSLGANLIGSTTVK